MKRNDVQNEYFTIVLAVILIAITWFFIKNLKYNKDIIVCL